MRQVCAQKAAIAVTVGFDPIKPGSLFHALTGEWNAQTVTLSDRKVITVHGRGAGRWPTTEAVMADVSEILRARGPK
jgi:homoserine dehydrogenase